ncbi:MAG TPA: GDP-mannose 4,6-dehydratase [Solirubrobacteraceae bacterium]|nr:GDP-mannose 4,6-dehydratase [Solirubrobacteraceae bacterium]
MTGASGFAGRHLTAACADQEVVGLSRAVCDLRDAEATRAAIADALPAVVYHLAARAHVGESWRDPHGTLDDNLTMALNVLEAVRAHAPDATVVAVASGEVYGTPERLPVDETAPLRPQNPYAVSKAAADLLAGMYADAHGLRVIRARAFNHAGPGQEPTYAIASFARQAAQGAERIVTGNPDTRRDYTDVRDVVRAYRLLAERAEPGVYNVCSGRTASTSELVRMLGVEHDVDPALLRPHEVMELRGSYDKLKAATGWEPEHELADTLRDTVRWWRDEPAPARTAAPRPEPDRSPRS